MLSTLGTTWSAELVYLIMTMADVETAKKLPLAIRVPFLDFQPQGTPSLDEMMEMPSPRIFKTHLYSKFFDTEIKKAKPKVIVVQRNPKDCLVSYFHFYKNFKISFGDYPGNFDDFFELYKHKHLLFGDFFDHIVSWWEHRNEENYLFTSYEELKKDVRAVIKKFATFLGKELSNEMVDTIAEHTSFEKMKNNPMVNMEPMVKDFMRKGIIGDWTNYFNDEQSQLIDEKAKEVEEKYGIKFQYK